MADATAGVTAGSKTLGMIKLSFNCSGFTQSAIASAAANNIES